MELLLNKLQDLAKQKGKQKILDVGGWFSPCKQATHMVDLMPFETMNVASAYGFGDLKITKDNYTQLDLCNITKLPYKDKEFDFVICKHTLEDLKDPILVANEMKRVAKAGYIEIPSRICESTKGVERSSWCGYYHHRWLIEIISQKIVFQFKPHNLHSSRKFYFRRWPWQKLKNEYMNQWLLWEGDFDCQEKIIIDYQDVKNNLIEFKNKNKNKNLFRWRFL